MREIEKSAIAVDNVSRPSVAVIDKMVMVRKLKDIELTFEESIDEILKFSLCKTCQNMAFLWAAFSRIQTESKILSFRGKIRVTENLYSVIFYAVSIIIFFQVERCNDIVFDAYHDHSMKNTERSNREVSNVELKKIIGNKCIKLLGDFVSVVIICLSLLDF